MLFKITDNCDGCGLCIDSCPLDVIVKVGEVYEIGIGCDQCGTCSGICTRGAIVKTLEKEEVC